MRTVNVVSTTTGSIRVTTTVQQFFAVDLKHAVIDLVVSFVQLHISEL